MQTLFLCTYLLCCECVLFLFSDHLNPFIHAVDRPWELFIQMHRHFCCLAYVSFVHDIYTQMRYNKWAFIISRANGHGRVRPQFLLLTSSDTNNTECNLHLSHAHADNGPEMKCDWQKVVVCVCVYAGQERCKETPTNNNETKCLVGRECNKNGPAVKMGFPLLYFSNIRLVYIRLFCIVPFRCLSLAGRLWCRNALCHQHVISDHLLFVVCCRLYS